MTPTIAAALRALADTGRPAVIQLRDGATFRCARVVSTDDRWTQLQLRSCCTTHTPNRQYVQSRSVVTVHVPEPETVAA